MDIQLDNILTESKLRYENMRAARLLGLFDSGPHKLQTFNIKQEKIVDKACEDIETILKG
jgi:hypothetical protein